MQRSPSNKSYSQALKKLAELYKKYSTLKTRSVDELALEIDATLKEVAESGGISVKYKEIEYGQIPSSFEMNQFLESLAYDVNVLLDEMEILNAASVDSHNFIKTEILKAEQQNAQLHNKIKVLQLYSASEDQSIIYAGDYFYSDEYIDWDLSTLSDRVTVWPGQYISLGLVEQSNAITSEGSVQIESGSNGFIGNNQEVSREDPVFFKNEYDDLDWKEKLDFIIDGQPNSFLEFENYKVDELARTQANLLNFTYRINESDPVTAYLADIAQDASEIDWSLGPENDVLTLKLMIDLGVVQNINNITINPYGLPGNINPPIYVSDISISENKTDWKKALNSGLWIANGIDQNSVTLNSRNISIGTASINVDSEFGRYVRVTLEQPKPIDVRVGHFYYTDEEDQEVRVEGPSYLITETWQEKDPSSSYSNDLIQRREAMSAKRWAIGLRDISVYNNRYKETSSMVSKKHLIPGGVDRVSIEADLDLPEGLGSDTAWVRFYISPDDGNTWHQISRIEENDLGIPEVIAYNDNTPEELRLQGIKYYDLINTPESLRVKIEIDRPTGDDSISPIVRSYRLKVKRKV